MSAMSTEVRASEGGLGGGGGVERPRLTAALIAGAYLVVAVLWIWGSDRVLHAMALPTEVTHQIEVWKGIGWVAFTAAVLYVLISRPLVRLTRARARALEAKAEAQSRAAELETVLEAVPVAVWIARDPECRVIDGSRVGREILGQGEPVNLSLSAPSGERPMGFKVLVGGREVSPDGLPVQMAARTGREVRDFEEELVFDDGRRVQLLGNASPLRDSEGRVIGAVGAFVDVTEREHVLRELERNKLIMEQAQELGQIGSWVSEAEPTGGGALEWSRETCRIFGMSPDEFDGRVETFFEMVHPEDRDAVRRSAADAKAGLREYEVEHRIVRRDGSERWVHQRARVERDSEGRPVRLLGVCQDITERVETEARLRESEARLLSAMEAASIICWETELSTGATSYSRDPIEYFGLNEAVRPALATGGAMIVHPEDREGVLRTYAEHVAGTHLVFETTFRSDTTGGERWYRCTGRLIRDRQGRAVRSVGVTQDITDRRAAEAALRKSEAMHRTIVETCQEGVWLVGADWRTTFVNQRMAEMLGRTPEEMIGKTVLEFLPEDEREKTLAHMREREAGIAAQHEYRFVRPGGEEIWALAATNALMDERGGFAGALAMFTDITERRRMEQAVRESEVRFRELFDALPDPAWDWDLVADETRHSATWSQLLGYPAGAGEEELGTWESMLHPEDRADVLSRLEACERGETDVYEAEYRLRCRDGSYRWVLSRGRVVDRGADGRARRMIGAITDMTERRRAEDDLRISEARFRTLIETAPEAVVVLDAESKRFTECNQQAGKLVGLPVEELLRRTPVEMSPEFQPDGRRSKDAAEEYIRRAIAGEKPEFEWTHVSADGRDIPCEVHLARLPDRDRVLIRGNITDITERKAAEARLRDRDALLRKLSEQVPGAIFQYQQFPDGRATFPYSSEGVRAIYEATPRQLEETAEHAYARIHPDDLPRVVESVKRSVETMELWQSEYRVVLPERGVRWIEGHSMPERLEDGSTRWHGHLLDVTERHNSQEALRASEEKYRLVLRATSDAMWDYEPGSGLLRWGDNVETMFGTKISELGDRLSGWSNRLHPEDRKRVLESFEGSIERGDERWVEEYRFRKGDGTYAVVLDRAYMLRDEVGRVVRIIGAMTDITERRLNEQLMVGQARTLEKLIGGEPLVGVLEEIVRVVEDVEAGCMASVLLLEEDGVHVRTAAAPNLPVEYSRTINGVAIGPDVGSCGTAMYRRERVIVTDIATDPLWAKVKDLALVHGLRACWSEPVVGAGGRVLGSLAMYYGEVRGPGEHELRTIAWAARLAGLAIERRRAEEQLRKRETDVRDLLNAVPDLMFRIDSEGRYLEYHAPNPADLLVPPEKFLGHTVREVMPKELAEPCMATLERVLKTGRTHSYEYQLVKERGLRHWEVRVTKCAEEQALMLVRDITVRRTAERKLRESEQRLSLLVRQSPLGVIVWDLDFRVAEWNAAAEQIFGWSSGDALGKHVEFILPESAKSHVAEVAKALRENRGGTRSTNANITRDGRTIYCEWYNAPLVDGEGKTFAIASIVDDVTEQRDAQQRQQLMMAELDHRVKNNLAAVISLAEQSGRTTTTFADFRVSFLGRVRALSRLHNALAATRWQGASLGTMVRQTLEAFGQDATSQAVVEGPALVLPPRAAQAMGMALNELCTNAIKYGALSVPGGRIEARWALRPVEAASGDSQGHGRDAACAVLEMLWAEHGGPAVSPPTRRGFGTELIEGAISYELGGSARLEYLPGGLCCRIRIELPADAEFDVREVQSGSLGDPRC